MDFYILITLLIMSAGVGAAIAYTRRRAAPLPRFSSRRKLLSESELEFIRVLEFALNDQYSVFPKLKLGDVVEPHSALAGSDRARLRERIGKIGLDCVLCDVRTSEVLAAIQLKAEEKKAQTDAQDDHFVEHALHSANMHLIRIPLKSSYTAADLAARIESVLTRDFVETLTLMPSQSGVRLNV